MTAHDALTYLEELPLECCHRHEPLEIEVGGLLPVDPSVDLIGLTGCRGVAQPGRALGSGPRGRRFKSCRPDQNCKKMAGFPSGRSAFRV